MTHAMDKSARVHDLNGWFEIKGNPLSKVGIYEYSGAQIGAPAADASKIFKVYRPAEELSSPETIESFKLIPFIDDHTMLGEGFTSTDDRPVSGVLGEDIYFEGDTLYGNPKVFSKALAHNIKNGKTELSCGYRCRYEFTSGTWNGQDYDVIQRTIRGNHLALVDEGRMGPEVSILDQLTFTVDAKELTPVDEQLQKIMDALAALSARLDAVEAAKVEETGGDEQTPEQKAADEEAAAAKAADEEAAKAAADAEAEGDTAKALDAVLKRITAMDSRITVLSSRPAMDEAAVISALAAKTALVEKLSPHIGTFDHASMTAQQVAEYGVDKLGIKGVAKGTERIALDAVLQAKPVPAPAFVATAADAASTSLGKAVAAFTTGA